MKKYKITPKIINEKIFQNWINSMDRLLKTYRIAGLNEIEVIEYILRQLNYKIINKNHKKITIIKVSINGYKCN